MSLLKLNENQYNDSNKIYLDEGYYDANELVEYLNELSQAKINKATEKRADNLKWHDYKAEKHNASISDKANRDHALKKFQNNISLRNKRNERLMGKAFESNKDLEKAKNTNLSGNKFEHLSQKQKHDTNNYVKDRDHIDKEVHSVNHWYNKIHH